MAASDSPTTRRSVSRAEHEALAAVVADLLKAQEADRAMRLDTHAMVSSLHRALIEPDPGHARGLLHRMAAVTIAAETGEAVGERIIWWAKVVGAVGVVLGALWSAITFGNRP